LIEDEKIKIDLPDQINKTRRECYAKMENIVVLNVRWSSFGLCVETGEPSQ
jgi:hypothetical protein